MLNENIRKYMYSEELWFCVKSVCSEMKINFYAVVDFLI